MAVRIHRRKVTVGDISDEKVEETLKDAGMTAEEADAIYALTSLPKFEERFVIPAAHREQAIEMMDFTGDTKGDAGFGFKNRCNVASKIKYKKENGNTAGFTGRNQHNGYPYFGQLCIACRNV